MKFYDIFDPNGYNNVFVFAYSLEPILVAGCRIPTSPEKRTRRVKAFYRWLSGFLGVGTEDKWTLHPCTIKPGPHPFSVDIDSAAKGPVEKDSIGLLSPGAYIILVDGTNYAPPVSADRLGSEVLLSFPMGGHPPPSAEKHCSSPGVNSYKFLLQSNRSAADTPQNYLTMASSLQPHFDQYAFGIDVDDDYRIIQFSKPSPEFDISNAGTLQDPPSPKQWPMITASGIISRFAFTSYLAPPPPGAQTFSMQDVNCLQDEVGLYEVDAKPLPPELPEVDVAATRARRCWIPPGCGTSPDIYHSSLISPFLRLPL